MTEYTKQYDDNLVENDDISLKEIILRIKSFLEELKRSWKLIFVVVSLFALYSAYKAFRAKPKYTATLTFMINKNEVGGIGSIGAILGKFGFGGKNEGNKDKIVQLNKSRRIIEKAIFKKVKINGNNDYLANHLINNFDTLNRWMTIPWYKKPFIKPNSLKNFRFTSNKVDSFNNLENNALKVVYSIIAGDKDFGPGIMSNGYDEDSGILHTSITSNDPFLSIELTNSIFDNLSKFYIEKTVEKQKVTYDIVKMKTDSLLNLLKQKEIALASFEDRAHGLFSNKSKLKELRLKRDVQKLSIMYGESIKNLEIADFAVKNKTPFVQAIDRPLYPLRQKKPSTVKSFILGGVIGMFLIIMFVIFRKIYRDIMA